MCERQIEFYNLQTVLNHISIAQHMGVRMRVGLCVSVRAQGAKHSFICNYSVGVGMGVYDDGRVEANLHANAKMCCTCSISISRPIDIDS